MNYISNYHKKNKEKMNQALQREDFEEENKLKDKLFGPKPK
jgi:hypothetical protein